MDTVPLTAMEVMGAPGFDPALRGMLLESRQRWRDFVTLAADLVFETDAAGRLTFLAPDQVLGWPAAALLGGPAQRLLVPDGADPFGQRRPRRGLKAWLRREDAAEPACFSFNVAPLQAADGSFRGLRGTARDVTMEERAADAQAALLRRAGTLETLVRRVRQEVLAPRMLATSLESLVGALGCAGAAVVEFLPGGRTLVIHRQGADPSPLLPALPKLLEQPHFGRAPGTPPTPFGLLPPPQPGRAQHALLAWRHAGERDFDADDRHLLRALVDLVFVALGNQTLQRELELQARTEPLTGLLNRRAFLDDLRRRLERQRLEPARGGALMFIDLDHFKAVNDLLGHEAGDVALVAVANLLREIVRPTDLVARFGGDEFALWLDRADAGAVAERAATICAAAELLPPMLRSGPVALTFSIGCAVAELADDPVIAPNGTIAPEPLLARADAAMYTAKRAGRNGWAIAPPLVPALAQLAVVD